MSTHAPTDTVRNVGRLASLPARRPVGLALQDLSPQKPRVHDGRGKHACRVHFLVPIFDGYLDRPNATYLVPIFAWHLDHDFIPFLFVCVLQMF
jgi:hypothetical protein